jgi:hypothetical protein
MKDRFEHIDELFKGKLQGHSPEPPAEVWEQINATFVHEKTPAISWWYAAASVVAAVTVGMAVWLTVGNGTLTPKDLAQDGPAIIENGQGNSEEGTTGLTNNTTAMAETSGTTGPDAADLEKLAVAEPEPLKVQIPVKTKVEIVQVETSGDGQESGQSALTNQIAKNADGGNITELASLGNPGLLAFHPTMELKKPSQTPVNAPQKDKRDFWSSLSVGGHVSPMFSYRNRGSSNTGSSEVPLYAPSGGLYIEGKINKKLSLKTGFYFLQIGNQQNNFYARRGYTFFSYEPENQFASGSVAEAEEFYYVTFDNSMGTIDLYNNASIVPNEDNGLDLVIAEESNIMTGEPTNRVEVAAQYSTNQVGDSKWKNTEEFEKVNANLMQRINSIEIPVALSFNFYTAKKLALLLHTGLSANILTNNYFYNADENIQIGRITNLRQFNVSGSIGLGMEYPVLARMKITVEPTFRYFLNSVNTEGYLNIHPYSFGIYTGVKYSL